MWNATSSTASMANMVFLLSRGIPFSSEALSLLLLRRPCRHAGRAEAAGPAGRPVELGDLPPHGARMTGDNHLCNSHAARDPEGFRAQIDENHPDFAAIIGVDR